MIKKIILLNYDTKLEFSIKIFMHKYKRSFHSQKERNESIQEYTYKKKL